MKPERIKFQMRLITPKYTTPEHSITTNFQKTCEIALQKRAAGHPRTTLQISSAMHWCGGKS